MRRTCAMPVISWVACGAFMAGSAIAARPLSLDDMFAFARISDAQISPDGHHAAYVVARADVAKNSTTSTIWIVPTEGGSPRQLTAGPKHDRHPRFSPDGKAILFESDRSGENQLWLIDLGGGEARQATKIATEAKTGIWSPDGKRIAFVSSVYPEYSDKPPAESDAANKKRIDEIEANPVKARVFDKLFYRHWDSWVEDKRQHLFVMNAAGGDPRDVTPGDRDGYPTSSTFSLGDDFTFTPDGKALVFAAPPEKDEAWSTNYDLYRVSVEGGPVEKLTDNVAADTAPRYGPDGKTLAYRAQNRPGYEADRWQIQFIRAGSGAARGELGRLDRSIDAFAWGGNDVIYCTSDYKATVPLGKLSLKDGKLTEVAAGGMFGSPSASADGKRVVATRATMSQPPEVVLVDPRGKVTNLSQANKERLAEIDFAQPESVSVNGAGGAPMQMWIVKPPGFVAAKKWPLVYLVHGGPQGAWEDGWSNRWNPQLWAAQGYVIALPNPRGSTGFGQKYVDQISGDWGGKCFADLMAGVDYLEKLPYIDRDRMAAAGASFGGYMMNWFEGHTDKFKTLITHCGVFNFDSMYSTTDELWFDEWEHGGPPWGHRESYEKHSPHRFAKDFKTPMLIIHNDLDFRVPMSEGYQLFTTLKRLGVPARLINFPDEGHWVLKPANSAYWHREVFAWLAKYVPPGGQ